MDYLFELPQLFNVVVGRELRKIFEIRSWFETVSGTDVWKNRQNLLAARKVGRAHLRLGVPFALALFLFDQVLARAVDVPFLVSSEIFWSAFESDRLP
jgi:hypothetical protein